MTFKGIILEISGQVGTITLNQPENLNAINNDLMVEITSAFQILNKHPETIITVLTGSGRFFSAGADVRNNSLNFDTVDTDGPGLKEDQVKRVKKKIAFMSIFATHIEMIRTIIDHQKVLLLALNGPAIGGGAAWFTGIADIVLASTNSYLQAPFSALGLVPELGSAFIFAQSIGVHRTNEFLIFGQQLSSRELHAAGLINRVFPADAFQACVTDYLSKILETNDGRSLMEAKRLTNLPLRQGRLAAVMESVDALAERFVDGTPKLRFEMKKKELEGKYSFGNTLLVWLTYCSKVEEESVLKVMNGSELRRINMASLYLQLE